MLTSLSVHIPGWSAAGAFPALQSLDVSGNALLLGALPAFGAAAAPFLQRLNLQQRQFAGAAPYSDVKSTMFEHQFVLLSCHDGIL